MTTVSAVSRSHRGAEPFVAARGGEEARGLADGGLIMDAMPALTLGGTILGGDFGMLVSVAAWILMVAAAGKIAVETLGSRLGEEPGDVPGALPARGAAMIAVAAALGFVTLAAAISGAPDSFRIAAAISTFSYVVLTAERDSAPANIVDLQALAAFGLFAAGLAFNWDRHAPVALAAALSVSFSLFLATRRRARMNAKALEAERQFTSAMNGMSQCVGMFDADGKLIACNSQFLRMFRLPGHSARGLAAEELLASKLGVRPKAARRTRKSCATRRATWRTAAPASPKPSI